MQAAIVSFVGELRELRGHCELRGRCGIVSCVSALSVVHYVSDVGGLRGWRRE